ncbi:MAG: dihydroxyacetone kinase subunit L [Mangrovicoccus sp.]|nr:dihydroxyacetone kinase subunit L [Mangrovicoccus sp.]
MQQLGPVDLLGLFDRLAARFERERDALIALDSHVGDSDLGLTMAKGFAAARARVFELSDPSPAQIMQQAGAGLAQAAPSTMGTLMGTGFLRGGKAMAAHEVLDPAGFALFWRGFSDGVAARGKARLGDKTVLDVLDPIACAFESQAQARSDLPAASQAALEAAAQALDDSKSYMAQHGKAAAFREKTCGLQDAGGTVAWILADELHQAVLGAVAEG